jgi:serine/threonine protein phosphatase PrpC
MRRSANQDSYCITLSEDREKWERSGHLLIVADGMGAHAAGELASRLSVDLIPHHFAKLNRGDPIRAILQATEEANSEIYRRGQANPEFRSMGTTTSSLLILPVGAVIAHVGDSRVYRLRGQTFEQLTFDHSLVWEMRASGEMSEEALKNNAVPKNVITRSLGPNPSVQVDLEGPFALQRGDRFLLCSDGLSGQIDDDEIGMLLGALDIQTAVRAMIDLANLRGGPDNITVLIAEVLGDELAVPPGSPAPVPERKFSYPVAFGVTAVVCVLASVVLLLVSQFPLAAVAAAAAVVAGVSGWIKAQVQDGRGDRSAKLGRAPYRKVQCKPNSAFAERLLGVTRELQEWIGESGIQVDQKAIDASLALGREALGARNYKQAISHFCEVLISMMRDARAKSDEKDDDAIDY